MRTKTFKKQSIRCHLCGSREARFVQEILEKPRRENDFKISPQNYWRSIYQCHHCFVYFNAHKFIPENFYESTYNRSVYQHKLLETYSHIMNLPEEKSDNKYRVKRIATFFKNLKTPYEEVDVLDVGSGLCVFLGGLKRLGFQCHCIDPDPIAIEHAIKNVGIESGFVGTLGDFDTDRKFDLITFNKVLEHVRDPVRVLKKAKSLLADRGVIYIELPDAQGALQHGTAIEREEFYIEHFTIFTKPSMKFLIREAGLNEIKIESIHEPSDKFTLYGFCSMSIPQ